MTFEIHINMQYLMFTLKSSNVIFLYRDISKDLIRSFSNGDVSMINEITQTSPCNVDPPYIPLLSSKIEVYMGIHF